MIKPTPIEKLSHGSTPKDPRVLHIRNGINEIRRFVRGRESNLSPVVSMVLGIPDLVLETLEEDEIRDLSLIVDGARQSCRLSSKPAVSVHSTMEISESPVRRAYRESRGTTEDIEDYVTEGLISNHFYRPAMDLLTLGEFDVSLLTEAVKKHPGRVRFLRMMFAAGVLRKEDGKVIYDKTKAKKFRKDWSKTKSKWEKKPKSRIPEDVAQDLSKGVISHADAASSLAEMVDTYGLDRVCQVVQSLGKETVSTLLQEVDGFSAGEKAAAAGTWLKILSRLKRAVTGWDIGVDIHLGRKKRVPVAYPPMYGPSPMYGNVYGPQTYGAPQQAYQPMESSGESKDVRKDMRRWITGVSEMTVSGTVAPAMSSREYVFDPTTKIDRRQVATPERVKKVVVDAEAPSMDYAQGDVGPWYIQTNKRRILYHDYPVTERLVTDLTLDYDEHVLEIGVTGLTNVPFKLEAH